MAINPEIFSYVVNEEKYPDKTSIVKEGGRGDWLYVILEGRAKIKKQTSKGMLTIDTLTEGDFIGEMALLRLGDKIRATSTIADGPVLVGTLDTERLVQGWNSQPLRLKKLISNLMQNLEEAIEKAVTIVEVSK